MESSNSDAGHILEVVTQLPTNAATGSGLTGRRVAFSGGVINVYPFSRFVHDLHMVGTLLAMLTLAKSCTSLRVLDLVLLCLVSIRHAKAAWLDAREVMPADPGPPPGCLHVTLAYSHLTTAHMCRLSHSLGNISDSIAS